VQNFVGKFISSYINKRELKVFLKMLLNPLILSIENSGLECMDMSLRNINKEVNKKKDAQNLDKNFDEWLREIPKTSINFKKNYIPSYEENEKIEFSFGIYSFLLLVFLLNEFFHFRIKLLIESLFPKFVQYI